MGKAEDAFELYQETGFDQIEIFKVFQLVETFGATRDAAYALVRQASRIGEKLGGHGGLLGFATMILHQATEAMERSRAQ